MSPPGSSGGRERVSSNMPGHEGWLDRGIANSCSLGATTAGNPPEEKRQLAAIKAWLEGQGYTQLPRADGTKFNAMPAGTFSFRMNVPVKLVGGATTCLQASVS